MWMITWAAMVNSRDRPREGARSAQRTYSGGVQRVPTGETLRNGADGCSLALHHFNDLTLALKSTRARRNPLPSARCKCWATFLSFDERQLFDFEQGPFDPRPRSGRFKTTANHQMAHLDDPVMRPWSGMPTAAIDRRGGVHAGCGEVGGRRYSDGRHGSRGTRGQHATPWRLKRREARRRPRRPVELKAGCFPWFPQSGSLCLFGRR